MAAGDMKINIGVSGVAQFKQGMKESQAAVKNLEQQLKLNEAQLKKTGNEELYLQNKTELLTKQIEEQKKVVSQANDALEAMAKSKVSKTSAAFQNMQQQVYKASTDLMNMQTELQNVGESGEEAQSGVSHMNQALQRIGTNVSFESVVSGIGKITDGLEAAAKKAYELGKKLVQAMLSGGQWADDLQTTADQWEMTPEQVYRMRQTANLIDTSAETIFQARKKMITAMGQQDNKDTMGAFAALGITYLAGDDTNIERVFWKAGEGLMDMEDKVARNEYAMKLFGKSWEELIPIFKTGREEYERTLASWDWVGDQQFEALTQLDDESQKTKSAWENIQHTLEAAMAPAMTEIMVALQGMMSEFNKYLQSEAGQEMLAKLNEAVSGLFTELTNLNPEEVIGKITEIFQSLENGFNWIINNKQSIYDALKLIAGGFALMKITSFAANLGRIVTGLSGLFGGGRTGGQATVPTTNTTPNVNATPAGKPAGSSGGKLVGLSNAVTGALSKGAATLTAFDPTGSLALLPQVLKDQTTLGRTLAQGGSVGEAVENSWETIKNSAEQGLKNFTDYFSKDLQSGMWGIIGVKDAEDLQWKMEHGSEDLQRNLFGSGTQHEYMLTEQDLARASLRLAEAERNSTQPMDRMTTVAGEMTGEVTVMRAANENMTAAANELMTMPAEMYTNVYNAIMAGMSNVTIVVDAGCVDVIGERIAGGWGKQIVDMVR